MKYIHIARGIAVLLAMLYAIQISRYSMSILQRKITRKVLYGLTMGTSAILAMLSQKLVPGYIVYIVMEICFLAVFYIGFKGTLLQFQFAAGNFIFHMMSMEIVITSAISVAFQTTPQVIMSDIVGKTVVNIILFTSVSFILHAFRKLYPEEDIILLVKSRRHMKLLVIIQVMLNTINSIGSMAWYMPGYDMVLFTYQLLIVVLQLIGFYTLFRYCIREIGYEVDRDIRKAQDHILTILKEYIKELRKIRHDYKNSLMALKVILQESKERGEWYLEELLKRSDRGTRVYEQSSNNIMIDALLQQEKEELEREQIEMKACIAVSEGIALEDFDLYCVIQSIIETLKVEGGQGSTLSIQSQHKAGWYILLFQLDYNKEHVEREKEICTVFAERILEKAGGFLQKKQGKRKTVCTAFLPIIR